MVNVVLANASYIQEIYELEKDLFLEEGYSLNSLKEELTNPNRLYLIAVAKNSNAVVGYVGVNLLFEMAEIMKIGVKQIFQRQGIAKLLFAELKKQLQKKGVSSINLEVDSGNVSAIGLYEHLGFAKISTRKNYYKNGNSAHVYSLQF